MHFCRPRCVGMGVAVDGQFLGTIRRSGGGLDSNEMRLNGKDMKSSRRATSCASSGGRRATTRLPWHQGWPVDRGRRSRRVRVRQAMEHYIPEPVERLWRSLAQVQRTSAFAGA
jgi:hypothetical protein